ncbi:hypothetical protein JHK86_019178 [Glycine max]|nr:hypothetical protein JHK86_019178 [Glycine max]
MEATSEEIKPKKEEIDAAEEMNKLGIVQATKIDGNKLWVKMIIEKKRGRFKKLMEAMDNIGIELRHQCYNLKKSISGYNLHAGDPRKDRNMYNYRRRIVYAV